MISYEQELDDLVSAGALDAGQAAPLMAVEQRRIFSIWGELRTLAWLGVMLIATGTGALLYKNIDRIGPLTIAGSVGLCAIGCYVFAWWKRQGKASLADESVLLLASMLLSADVGYVEHTFHLLGSAWPRHFLLLALVHAAVAYLFESQPVLTISVSALAAFLGFNRNLDALLGSRDATTAAARAFLLAAILLAWREVDRRWRPSSVFSALLAHMMANAAFWGALILSFDASTRPIGVVLALAFSIASALYGMRVRKEAYVFYGYVYGIIALDVFVVGFMSEGLAFFYLVNSTIVAIVGLFLTHVKLRGRA